MSTRRRRKCRHCRQLFRPDPPKRPPPVRIPGNPITDSGVNLITESGHQGDCRSHATTGEPSQPPREERGPALHTQRRWRPGPCNRVRLECRYGTSSACISQRLRPVVSRRTKSAEPKRSVAEPRTVANRPAICASRSAGRFGHHEGEETSQSQKTTKNE